MAEKFLEIAFTESVREAQQRYYGRPPKVAATGGPDVLTEEEIEFIGGRDSFYLATVSEAGWPYMQHRGGPRGFLRVISPTELAFGDYSGNRQLLSTGNLARNNRVCLFFMDYPQRTRLKILGHARVVDAREHPELAAQFAGPGGGPVERIFQVRVVGFDWNCPKHITPRYTAEEVETAVAPLRRRIAELEEQLNRRP